MFRHINGRGGVHGRSIEYTYVDDAGDPAKADAAVDRLLTKDRVFAVVGAVGTATHAQVAPRLNAERVPDLFVASPSRLWDQPDRQPYTFGWAPSGVVEGKVLGRHLREAFAGKRVGLLFETDDYGRDGVSGVESQLGLAPGVVVARQPYTAADLAQPSGLLPQLTSLKTRRADVVVTFGSPAAVSLALLTADRIGFDPQFVVSGSAGDPATLTTLLAASKAPDPAALLDGLLGTAFLPAPSDGGDAWIRLFREVHEEHLPNLPFDGTTVAGMAAAVTFAQALEAAGQNPTRESIVEAVERGGFRGPGLTALRYGSASHAGYSGLRMTRLDRSGRASYLGPAYATTEVLSDPVAPAEDAQRDPQELSFLRD